MRSLLLILICTLSFSNSFAVNSYFYRNQKIDLKERNDKLVVVLNQYGKSKQFVESELKSLITSGSEFKQSLDNIYVINYKSGDDEYALRSDIAKLSSRTDLVKFVTPAFYSETKRFTIICADEFIVKLKTASDKFKLEYLNQKFGVAVLGNIGNQNCFYLKTINGNSKTSLDLSAEYLQAGLFEYCEPNFIYPDGEILCYTPNDTRFGGQWNLYNTSQTVKTNSTLNGDVNSFSGLTGADMNITKAWDYTLGSSSVEVGVFDTGIDSTHPDLSANVLTGYDAVTNTYGVPYDSISFAHGTNCAGIIGAVTNNNLGVSGIAGGCRLRAYKIFTGTGSTSTVIQSRAFDSARTAGLPIISCSWEANVNATLTTAINNCATSGRGGLGCVIFFAAGNDGKNPPSYPSYLANVISVGSSTPYDQKKDCGTGNNFNLSSNYGEDVNGDLDCVAPSICPTVDIQGSKGDNDSAGTAGDYSMIFGGTSASCANAAGVAALVLSANTSLNRAQIIDRLLRGCDKIDLLAYSSSKTYGRWNSYTGYGRLDAYNSVRLASSVDVTPPTINHTAVLSTSSTYPVSFSAEIIDNDGSAMDTSVYKPKVFYRTNKSNAGWSGFDSAIFISSSSNNYNFTLPGFGWETQVQYYIKAKDSHGNAGVFPFHAPDTTNLCYFAVGNIQSVSQKISSFTLPTFGTAVSSTVSFSSFNVLKSKIKIYLTHTWVQDMFFILWNPGNNSSFTRKSLFSKSGPLTPTTGISGAIVMDSASQFWNNGSQPWSGALVKPDYSLEGYNGLNASGNWKILYNDNGVGDGGTCDSVVITLYKTAGTTSSCAKLESSSDSILYFTSTSSLDTLSFYLKNKGTANLTVSAVSFSGTYAGKYSLISSLPGAIAPNDSGLFRVQCNPLAKPPRKNEFAADNVENATMDITTNDPSKGTFKVSLQSDSPLPVELNNFNASVNRNNIKLSWSTVSEINNKGFEVQKSSDNLSWQILSFINGNGTSNQINNYTFEERNVPMGKYKYRLKQIDFNGNFKYYNLQNEVNIGIPDNFMLMQNYPNPFNPSTTINFDLPADSRVNLSVYDISGRIVVELLNTDIKAGYHIVKFNASNLASGIYFYNITAILGSNNFVANKRMVLIK